MPIALRSWWTRRPNRQRRLGVERLEHRILFAGDTLATATALSLLAWPTAGVETAQTSGFLATANEVDLSKVSLNAGDRLAASVSAQTAGSGLQSLLRVFDSSGRQLALDDQEGGDPRLTFQAETAGDYYLGVSSAPNDDYDPQVSGGGTTGGTTGLYTLNLRDVPLPVGASLQEDLTGGSFRLGAATAVWGDVLPAAFTVENRGGAAADSTATVRFVLSTSSTFATPAPLYEFPQTFSLAGLGPGQAFSSPAGFTVTLPAMPAGFSTSGPVYLGVQVLDNPALDSGVSDKVGVHRGADWETLTLLTPVQASGQNGTQAAADVLIDLDSRVSGALTAGQAAWYQLDVEAPSQLTAAVAGSGSSGLQLAVYSVNDELLVQSNASAGGTGAAQVDPHLNPGRYYLVVSTDAGAGNYRLSTELVAANAPFEPLQLPVNSFFSSAVADATGDGIPDLIVAGADTVSVLPGIGDGAFGNPLTSVTDAASPTSIIVADLTGDGHPDIVLVDPSQNSLTVLLNRGNGFFQEVDSIPLGLSPFDVTAADLTGNGIPDLVVAATNSEYQDVVSVLLGNGDGTFQPPKTVPTGKYLGSVFVADVNGDGVPDLVAGDAAGVQVLLGNGDGAFQAARTVAVHSDLIAVADIDGDGKPDLITAYYPATLSLRLGNGDGTFQAPRTISTLATTFLSRNTVTVADLTGDGHPDILIDHYQVFENNNRNSNVYVLLNNGDDSFQDVGTLALSTATNNLVAVDVTGDGHPDIVAFTEGFNAPGAALVLLGKGDGTFQNQPTFATGTDPLSVAVGDLTGDGKPDLVVANYGSNTISVLLGNGDGTFQQQTTLAAGNGPSAVALADLNDDGKLDIVVADKNSDTVRVFLGNGDGAFQPERSFAAGYGPTAVAVADLTGDGIEDLVVADYFGNAVSVLMGNGDGTFQAPQIISIGSRAYSTFRPQSLAVADVNGDGKPDVIVTELEGGLVLLGNGDGTFQKPIDFSIDGQSGPKMAAADLTGNGKTDLVVTDLGNDVGVLLGNGDGTFQKEQLFNVGLDPVALAVADLTGDGKPDIVAVGYDGLSVLLGNGDGTFQPPLLFDATTPLNAVAVADVNNDGRPDLIATSATNQSVTVLLNAGGNTFTNQGRILVGPSPDSVAVADLTGDGKQDVITANYSGGDVSVLLGNGDGAFQPPRTFATGGNPDSVTVADLTGNGKPDIIVGNFNFTGHGSISVLLDNGDGTLQPPETIATDIDPGRLVVADVNGDGKPDLIVEDYLHDSVDVLLNNGDGTFQAPYSVATGMYLLAAADLNGDGKTDLILQADRNAVLNGKEGQLVVMLGNGNGGFSPPVDSIPSDFVSAVAADLTGDGKTDVIGVNFEGNTVGVLLSNGDGTFRNAGTFAVGSRSYALAVADVNGDGKPDLIVANRIENTVSVLLGNGDGTFQNQEVYPVGPSPASVAVADVTGDGIPDVITANETGNSVSVLLGNGDGTFQEPPPPFVPATPATGIGQQNTPYLADLNGDGISDSVILDSSGNILFRKGLPGADQPFAPPQILNPGRPARNITVVEVDDAWVVAAADTEPDPALSSPGNPVYTVSLYTVADDGAVTRSTAFATPVLPTRIAAADLTADGRDDLVVANSLDDSVTIAFQTQTGQFGRLLTLPVGSAPSDLALVDVNGDGLPDIVVSDQASGDVTVLLNDASHSFTSVDRFRAGTGVYDLQTASAEQPVSLVVGDFTGDGRTDLVVVNRGTNTLTVLTNDGNGSLTNPQADLTIPLGDDQPGPVVAGYFHGPGQALDLAVLMEDIAQVWIFTGDGHGHFTHTATLDAGTLPTGLSVVPGFLPGRFNLLVGNAFGDVLTLIGDGQGNFAPPPPLSGDSASLDVLSSPGATTPVVVVADQAANLVTLQAAVAGGAAYQTVQTLTAAAQVAPGAVQFARLEGPNSPFIDAVVLASGANSVLVYDGVGFDAAGDPVFAPVPQTYFVGADPVGLTIADVNGDGILDILTANKGSDDVSVLFGSIDGSGRWVGRPGPRLKSGGSGPIAVDVLADANSLGGSDLAVTNGQSGGVAVLPGRGQGFFDDRNPTVLQLPAPPVQPPSFAGGVGFAPTADGRVIAFDAETLTSLGVVFTPSAGQGVVALEALDDGLVVAEQDGAVEMLRADDAGQFQAVEAFASLDGTPESPSALQVVETASGQQVLVTSAGQDKVFVFTVLSAEPPAAGLPASSVELPEPPSGLVVHASAPADAPLVLVASLAADTLSGESGRAAAAVPAGENAVGSTELLVQASPQTQVAGEDGDGPLPGALAAAGPPALAPGPPEPGVDRGPPEVDLYRPTEDPTPARLLSRRTEPDSPWAADRVFAALGTAGRGQTGRAEATPEVVVAALAARQTADLLWRQASSLPVHPMPVAPEEVSAVAMASAADASGRDGVDPEGVLVESDRWDWRALLAAVVGVGLAWRTPAPKAGLRPLPPSTREPANNPRAGSFDRLQSEGTRSP